MSIDLLPFKLAVVPALIWLISYIGRRWGPVAAGSLSAFPVVVGPALFFIAIEQGSAFAANAAIGSLSSVLALIAFSLAYAWAATRLSWGYATSLALLVYCITVVLLHAADFSIAASTVIVVAVLLFVRRVFPRKQRTPLNFPTFKLDVPLRMIVGGCLVFGLTAMAGQIGANWSGIFAMFPVTGSVLLIFSHIYQGKEFAINLVHGMFLGWCSITAFCFSVGYLLPTVDIAVTFTLALCLAFGIQGIGYILWRPRTASLTTHRD